jgi:AraC-like DNA-binding protein
MASSFTRWFITQFGMPPAAWRSAQKQPKAPSEPSTLPGPTEPWVD